MTALAVADLVLAGEVCLILVDVAWSATSRRRAERTQRLAMRHTLPAVAVDADASPELARRFQVTAAPSLLLFRGGHVVDRRVGELSERELEEWLVLTLED